MIFAASTAMESWEKNHHFSWRNHNLPIFAPRPRPSSTPVVVGFPMGVYPGISRNGDSDIWAIENFDDGL